MTHVKVPEIIRAANNAIEYYQGQIERKALHTFNWSQGTVYLATLLEF